MLPQSLLGLVAGVWIDRWDRKRTMILADGFIAPSARWPWRCSSASAPRELWHVYALLSPAARSARLSTPPPWRPPMPLLAPAAQLTRIAGVNQSLESASSIAGPALGALLLAFAELSDILLLDVAGALIACGSLAFVRICQSAAQRHAAPRPAARNARVRRGHPQHPGHDAVLRLGDPRALLHHACGRALSARDAPATSAAGSAK